MTATEHHARGSLSWFGRVAGARLVVFVAALVLTGFVAAGLLPLMHGAIGFVVIATAALISSGAVRRDTEGDMRAAGRDEAQSSRAMIDALISALPDPVIALDREGLVIAFNARARAMAPALRSGEP